MKTLPEHCQDHWTASGQTFAAGLGLAEKLTARYREHEGSPPSIREAAVLEEQFRHQFLSPEDGEPMIGAVRYPLVGLSPEPLGLGYYCASAALEEGARRYPAHAAAARSLIDYWKDRTTAAKTRAAFPEWVADRLPSDAWTEDSGVGFPLYRMAGTVLDYGHLLDRGLEGLEADLDGTPFAHVVPLLRGTLDRYLAHDLPEATRDCLRAVRGGPPRSFLEATQLFWLYALHAGTWNYGRLDTVLGPFLARDLDSGRLGERDALQILCSLWRRMHAYDNQYNNRVIVGGKGRPDEAAADRFALLAIEATRRVRLNQPQLSLRFYEGQNPELWERALDAIGEGCTFPMLYNDDVNIPAVARAFGVEEETAVHYTPYGCGEYVLGHLGENSPNGVINLLKALEVALHGGRDPRTGRPAASGIGPVEELTTFEKLWEAYARVVEESVEALARQQKIEYAVMAEEAPLGFISALTADCVPRGLSAFGGGARYLGGTLETYGNTNAADSLHTIEEVVFRGGQCSLRDLVEALDADFHGYPDLHEACRRVSKYGNDEGTADAMACRVHEHGCRVTAEQAEPAGLDSYLVVIINNWANTVLGRETGASADGRKSGQPMANGNNPSPGLDTSGTTAFLHSLTRLNPAGHAGAVQNMKFSRGWFGEMRPKFDALLRAYFANGGTQAMITVVSRDDLEAAMREPEKWGHLMVRVGGFSIRFVDLPRDAQRELLERTLN